MCTGNPTRSTKLEAHRPPNRHHIRENQQKSKCNSKAQTHGNTRNLLTTRPHIDEQHQISKLSIHQLDNRTTSNGRTTQATGSKHPKTAIMPIKGIVNKPPHDSWPHISAGSLPCKASQKPLIRRHTPNHAACGAQNTTAS